MSRERLDEIRTSIAEWVERPSERAPEAVRAEVLARIEEGRRPRIMAFAAAAVAVVGLATALLVAPRPPIGGELRVARTIRAAALHRPVLVYELSSGTTLYVTLNEAPEADSGAPAGGQRGRS